MKDEELNQGPNALFAHSLEGSGAGPASIPQFD